MCHELLSRLLLAAGLALLAAFAQGGRAFAEAAEQTVIGYSRGGMPITVYHFGSGPTPVLILGGQHGGPEVNTVRLAHQLIAHFERWPQDVPPGLRLDILPEANPDGLAMGSRQFLSGVDPNRNWGGNDWAPDAADSNGAFRRGLGGTEPFSEPETQSLRDYILATRPALVINYHSRGGFLFGGRSGSSAEISEAYAIASGYWRPTPGGGGAGGGGSVLGYRATGNMNGWLSLEGIPGLLIELATSWDPEFSRNLAAVREILPIVASQAAPLELAGPAIE